MNCNCPNGSYGKKHTAACYDALAARLAEAESVLADIVREAHMHGSAMADALAYFGQRAAEGRCNAKLGDRRCKLKAGHAMPHKPARAADSANEAQN
jgi:hypothetical protein